VARIGGDFFGDSEEPEDAVDQVATEFKHHSAGEVGELLALGGGDDLTHDGVDFEDFPEPAFVEEFLESEEGGVVAVHVAHLDEEVFLFGQLDDALEVGEGGSGGLIEVNVLAGLEGGFGVFEEVGDIGFDEDGIEARGVEELFASEPGEISKVGL